MHFQQMAVRNRALLIQTKASYEPMAVLGINSSNKGTAANGNNRQYLSNAFHVSGIMLKHLTVRSSHFIFTLGDRYYYQLCVCVDEKMRHRDLFFSPSQEIESPGLGSGIVTLTETLAQSGFLPCHSKLLPHSYRMDAEPPDIMTTCQTERRKAFL